MSTVAVVGAGPAGATLAYLLAQQGIDVYLLERRSDFAREFRGEVLMPSGVDALEQMGLLDLLDATPSYTQHSAQIYMSQRSVFRLELDAEEQDTPKFMAVSQPGLLEAIVERASQFPSFHFVRGAAVKELVRNDACINGVRYRNAAGEQQLDADLVIGTDGRNSIVRRQLSLPVQEISPPMDIVWCELPCPEDWRGVRGYVGGGHLLVAYRKWDQKLQLGWVILKGTFGELRQRGIEQWIEEMAKQVTPDFAEHLRQHRAAAQKPFLLAAVSDCVERWSAPGALVLGDAAHTMSPVGGQGLNVALRDSIVAANYLVPVLKQTAPHEAEIDRALRDIQTERMPEISQIQQLQAQPPKLVLSRAWWGESLRTVVAMLLSRAALRRRAGQRVAPFFFGITKVELQI
ncbi:MAG: FAD-dependent oxidoreductase [Pseudomonadales bacterium]